MTNPTDFVNEMVNHSLRKECGKNKPL